jgi:hypothetical protein
MTYVPDGMSLRGSGYTRKRGLTAIGWLDGDRPYHRGPVPAAFTAALRQACLHGAVRLTRGYHPCTLCPRDSPYPVVVVDGDESYAVGHAEVRVEDRRFRAFAAPNMVIHYVEQHDYRPPDAFIAAVLRLGVRPVK